MPLVLCENILDRVTLMKKNRNYLDLIELPTFGERFEYLKLNGVVGKDTFGFTRWVNQVLYTSVEWRSFRRTIILRDNGMDLGCEGFEIYGSILCHHLTAITYDDVVNKRSIVFDPNNLISTTLKTHNAIHYGDIKSLSLGPIERVKNDTCPWR